MKKLLIMAVAACCLAACNKELGPEYKVAARNFECLLQPRP